MEPRPHVRFSGSYLQADSRTGKALKIEKLRLPGFLTAQPASNHHACHTDPTEKKDRFGIKDEVSSETDKLKASRQDHSGTRIHPRGPTTPASQSYVKMKGRDARRWAFYSVTEKLPPRPLDPPCSILSEVLKRPPDPRNSVQLPVTPADP